MKQSINHQSQHVSIIQFSRTQKDKIKHQPKLDLLKSLLKDQTCQLTQKSQISTSKQHRRIQKIQVEPELKIDELKEHKWQILSQNCQYLLELSRQILDKPNYELLYRSTSNPRLNSLLLQHDQVLKSNINGNSKQNINNQQTNPIQTKFAFIQPSNKQRSSNKSFNINNNVNVVVSDKPFLKKHQSLHVSPTHQSQPSQSQTKFFFAKLNQVSSNAYNLQRRLKKEQYDEIKQTNEKVVCIRSDFDKFSKMLNESEQN